MQKQIPIARVRPMRSCDEKRYLTARLNTRTHREERARRRGHAGDELLESSDSTAICSISAGASSTCGAGKEPTTVPTETDPPAPGGAALARLGGGGSGTGIVGSYSEPNMPPPASVPPESGVRLRGREPASGWPDSGPATLAGTAAAALARNWPGRSCSVATSAAASRRIAIRPE